MHSRWTSIEYMLGEFQMLLAANTAKFKIEEGIDCRNIASSTRRWPALKKPGVYLIFDETETLVYIGSAVSQPLIDRVRTHLKSKKPLKKRSRWIDIIPFDFEWSLFAPALELFLIQKTECSRLVSEKGDKLVNSVGMMAGLRECFNKTWSTEAASIGSG